MSLYQEYKVINVHSGQRRPYADSTYVTRFEHWEYDWRGENGKIYDPTTHKYYNDNRTDEEIVEQYNKRLFQKALVVLDIDGRFRTRDQVNMGSAEDYFKGWYDYCFPENGVVEITFTSPYTD